MKKKLVFLLLLLSFMSLGFSQNVNYGRQYVHEAIAEANYAVQTIAMTKSSIVAVYDSYGYVEAYLPRDLSTQLAYYNQNGWYIYDIHIAENDEWVIVGDKITWSANVPADCVYWIQKLLETERIDCVSFNSYGDWCIVGSSSFVCSDDFMKEQLIQNINTMGTLLYVNVTNNAIIARYEDGITSSIGFDVPIMQDFLKNWYELDYSPTIVKLFYDGSFFFGNQRIGLYDAYF